ncbi:MAG: endonuclease III [Chloroflexota bacterium]|nr:endonuclease III [Chloroflexota bacterium]
MSSAVPRDVDRPTVALVLDRLRDYYGEPAPRVPTDPLDELIATILSQHTSDTNTERAFASLKARFAGWEDVAAAPVAAVADAIRSGGLAQVKAPRILRVLRTIRERRGGYSLAFLNDLSVAEAREWLTSLDGVGPKTAACVLLFACGLPALPVDTHVHRVSRRLGLIGPKVGEAAAHRDLEAIVPAGDVYAFHMLLIRHGRTICKAPRPRCAVCPLDDVCPKIGLGPEHDRAVSAS